MIPSSTALPGNQVIEYAFLKSHLRSYSSSLLTLPSPNKRIDLQKKKKHLAYPLVSYLVKYSEMAPCPGATLCW